MRRTGERESTLPSGCGAPARIVAALGRARSVAVSAARAVLVASPGSLLLAIALGPAAAAPDPATLSSRLSPALSAALAASDPQAFVPVLLSLHPPLDLAALEREMDARGIRSRWRRHEFVLRRAQAHAAAIQARLLAELETEATADRVRLVQPFWVTNAIGFQARADAVARLALSPEAARVDLDREVFLKIGTREGRAPRPAAGDTLESGLRAIRVEGAWERGLTGKGRLIGHFDSGADGTHEAYADRWRGARGDVPWQHAWFDPYTGSQFPFDNQEHGTGSLGVLVGKPPSGPPLGVAFEAEWIAAGVVIRYNVTAILSAFQWAADPDGDPGTIHDVPDVLNHSWGTVDDCATTYWDAIDLVEAAGIVNIIAVNNSGPLPGSVDSPESRAASPYENFGVGAVNANEAGLPVRSDSGRGPSPCDGASIKPELVGPGTAVKSTGRNNGYIYYSGTSFAAPHVSGVAALLRQLDPDLTVRDLKHVLLVTAQDLGPTGEDNDTGFGLVDATAAVEFVERHFSPSPPPYLAVGPSGPAPVALLRWAPPRFLGRVEEKALRGYRIYRADGDGPLVERIDLPPFPTEYWDRSASGRVRYVLTALYEDGSESEPTFPVTMEIVPPGVAGDPAGASSSEPIRLAVQPNPFRDGARIDFELAAPGAARLDVLDPTGRRLRTILHAPSASGSVWWDGRDDRGERLPAGPYFLRLSGPAGDPFAVRVVRLR